LRYQYKSKPTVDSFQPMSTENVKRGLFIGLVTLDLVYRAKQLPTDNQKIVASDYIVSAGGPATNAAVAFNQVGGQATVLGALGIHPITQLILADLQTYGVAIADLAPNHPDPPPVSSIIVTEATGERAVISINAAKIQAQKADIPTHCFQNVDIVLIDGHQMEVGRDVAEWARTQQIPVVVDAGSWKAGFDTVISQSDFVICSANFHPPDCQNDEDVMAFLSKLNVPNIAITHGEKPIQYRSQNQSGWVTIPLVKAVDTLGAGDIFHGAFCYAILQKPFSDALAFAAGIAAHSCRFFGTRRWMEEN